MDLKKFIGKNYRHGQEQAAPDTAKKDIAQMMKSFENRSEADLIEELRQAKKSGAMNPQALARFFASAQSFLPKEQIEQMKKLVQSLE